MDCVADADFPATHVLEKSRISSTLASKRCHTDILTQRNVLDFWNVGAGYAVTAAKRDDGRYVGFKGLQVTDSRAEAKGRTMSDFTASELWRQVGVRR